MVRLVRGLTHRAGSATMVALVALVASAAAATGPAYYASARTSILRDTFASAPLAQRGIEVTLQGPVAHGLDALTASVGSVLSGAIPNAADRDRLFATPVDAVEGTANLPALHAAAPLAWRTDFCGHLRLVSGHCPTAPDAIAVSSSTATSAGWRVGQRIDATGWPALTVTGIYAVPDFSADYWFGRGATYFPAEDFSGGQPPDVPPPDAFFTPRETIDAATGFPQGTLVVDDLVNVANVRGGDLGALATAAQTLSTAPSLIATGASVQSGLSTVVGAVHDSWRSLAVPLFLITAQLLVLVWLLMFLAVTDAVDARGPEIALMKLRGFRGARLLWFALGEPVTLLAVALPLGVGLGWAVTAGLDAVLLRAGTPVALPALAWAAAAAATLGGLVAVVTAARRTLRRPIVEQWQRTGREATRRGWVIDAIAVTGAVAGVIELRTAGDIRSVGHSSLGLLVPGLVGIAVAVVAARLLPMACRALFAPTRKRGSLGVFLAVRHVARRPAGARTTIILATAFALATFGIAAWSVGNANRSLAAEVGLGAPTVLTVSAPPAVDLGNVVQQIDPSGNRAAVVDTYLDATGTGHVLLAVDPQRFTQVAQWRQRFADRPLASLMQEISPPAAPPIRLDGDMIRVHLDVGQLSRAGQVLSADIASAGADSALGFDVGTLDATSGPVTLTQQLRYCPCSLVNLSLSTGAVDASAPAVHGAVTLRGIDVHGPNGWTAVPSVTDAKQWKAPSAGDSVTATASGPRWSFGYSSLSAATLAVADIPDPLPAVVSRGALGGADPSAVELNGLNQQALTVQAVAVTSALPGTLGEGAIVDRTYAERAAAGVLSALTVQQVWVAHGAADAVAAGLKKAGVRITRVQTAAAQAKLYDRQGPGLASTAFVADAVAAAILAAGGAALSLAIAGRRRRYEYAALRATGATRSTLYVGLLLEQLAVLVFGAVVGVAAGIVAALVAIRSLPEFVTQPSSPPLSYVPDAATLAPWLGIALVLLVAVAAASSWLLLAGVRADQLREGAA